MKNTTSVLGEAVMKRVIAQCAVLAVLTSVTAMAADAKMVAYEGFNYSPVGSDVQGRTGGGSFGFVGGWYGNDTFDLASGSLADPSGILTVAGNRMSCASYRANRDVHRDFSDPIGTDGTTTYFSFLIQPQGTLGEGYYGGWFGLAFRGGAGRDLLVGSSNGVSDYVMEVHPTWVNSRTVTSEPLTVDHPVLLVLKAEFAAGNDTLSLYINPTAGAPEPAADTVKTDLDLGLLPRISLSGTGAYGFDEFRAATTFAEVTPVPEPATLTLLAIGGLALARRRRARFAR